MKQTNLRTYIKNGVPNEQIERAFKDFMQSTCRVGMTPYKRFNHFSFISLEPISLYQRLVYNYDTNEAHYIGGQDYPSEIKRLKKFMLKN